VHCDSSQVDRVLYAEIIVILIVNQIEDTLDAAIIPSLKSRRRERFFAEYPLSKCRMFSLMSILLSRKYSYRNDKQIRRHSDSKTILIELWVFFSPKAAGK